MALDLDRLQLFIDANRLGGFAAAARHRGLDPSQVSRAIAGLESSLGLRLFQRTTRRLALTEAGARYLERIEPLIEELSLAAERARESGGIGGRLRLTASVTYGVERLVPLLPDLRARFPALGLDLLLTDLNLDLVGDAIDLAILLGPHIPPGAVGVALHGVRYGLYASPAWVAAHPLAAPADLAGERCLLWAGPQQSAPWRFRREGGATAEVVPAGDLALSAPLALRDAARAGLGPTLLPDWLVAADLAAGRLVAALPGWTATTAYFGAGAWLLYPSRAHVPAKVRAVIDVLRARLGDGGNAAGA